MSGCRGAECSRNFSNAPWGDGVFRSVEDLRLFYPFHFFSFGVLVAGNCRVQPFFRTFSHHRDVDLQSTFLKSLVLRPLLYT